mmetsp:Transcript_52175/g.59607  ORF Transcript_52175/g.59607 Transcript_52175/m.59607 type:complete len:215 (+) Transcript_52175:79-723(+)
MAVTVHYFDLNGRADPIRFLLYHAKVEFEDKRYSFEQFPTVKGSLGLPFGQLPMVEFEGKKLTQTAAIMSFFGAKYGYTVSEADDVYLSNWYKEATGDLMLPYYAKILFNKDEEDKKKELEKFMSELLPKYLALFEEKFNETGAKEKGYLVKDKITLIDFVMIPIHEKVINGPLKDLTRPVYEAKAPNFLAWVEAKIAEHNYYFGTDKRPERMG